MRFAFPKNPSAGKKIINILFFTAVALVILNLAIDKIFPEKIYPGKKLSTEEIDAKFRSALFNFGLEPQWVKKIGHKKNDSLYVSYRVGLPPDLPVLLILKEINESFKGNDIHIKSEELSINGKTKLKIYSDDQTRLAAEFKYDQNLKRNAGEIGFLLLDQLNLSEKEDSLLLNSPELFKIVLIPSKNSAEEAVKISKHGKKYALLLNDEISEVKYYFKEGYSDARLRTSVREILTDFPEVQFFITDDHSGLCSSSVFPSVQREFLKRNLMFYKISSFDLIDGAETEKVISGFENIAISREKRNILTSAHNYFLLQPLIMKYKKIGCKFVLPY